MANLPANEHEAGDVARACRLNSEQANGVLGEERGGRKLYCGGERERGITLITRGPGILFQTTRRHFWPARELIRLSGERRHIVTRL